MFVGVITVLAVGAFVVSLLVALPVWAILKVITRNRPQKTPSYHVVLFWVMGIALVVFGVYWLTLATA